MAAPSEQPIDEAAGTFWRRREIRQLVDHVLILIAVIRLGTPPVLNRRELRPLSASASRTHMERRST